MNIRSLSFRHIPYMYLRGKRELYHILKFGVPSEIHLLFILGCQRSGTTLLTRIFENDYEMKVYGEFSVLSSQDRDCRIRLNPLDQVKMVLERSTVPGVVLKPLVESQNAVSLLDYFANSRAVWVFRHYKDVSVSNVNKFGKQNGIQNLRAIVKKDRTNWRSERVSADIEKTVCSLYSEKMNPYDAAALFWFVRNSLFFELGLNEDRRVNICKYDDLVSSPAVVMKSLYKFISCRYPGDRILKDIHVDSIGKGQNISLSPEIEALCHGLLCSMDDAYRSGKAGLNKMSSLSTPGEETIRGESNW